MSKSNISACAYCGGAVELVGWTGVEVNPCAGEGIKPVDVWTADGLRVADCVYISANNIYMHHSGKINNVTHWMPLPQPPTKKGGLR